MLVPRTAAQLFTGNCRQRQEKDFWADRTVACNRAFVRHHAFGGNQVSPVPLKFVDFDIQELLSYINTFLIISFLFAWLLGSTESKAQQLVHWSHTNDLKLLNWNVSSLITSMAALDHGVFTFVFLQRGQSLIYIYIYFYQHIDSINIIITFS